jgi:hypothetical protein
MTTAGFVFEMWKENLNTISSVQAEYEKWLFIQVSGVLFGGKTGELLVLREEHSELSCKERITIAEYLCNTWELNLFILHQNTFSCKILLYKMEILVERLNRVPEHIMHRQLEYPPNICAGSFLAELSRRWYLSGKVQHEIGIALGYPFKDVWGFMGLSNQQSNGSCGWRIFGNPDPSLKKREQFKEARRKALHFLHAA